MKILGLLLLLLSQSTFAIDYEFPENFLFGVSNASAQVEDQLDDPWMKFAKDGKTKAFLNASRPEEKLQFWSKPEIEIELAKKLGVQVFRMSLDWQRIMPEKNKIDYDALKRYQEICRLVKANGMKVMMSLFHHSIPGWAIETGGYLNIELVDQFVLWGYESIKYLKDDVDFWITYNEPNVYAMFSYVAGIWPPGKKNPLGAIQIPFYKGDFFVALDNMAESHNKLYKKIKAAEINSKIGIAHNTANYKESGWFSSFSTQWSWRHMNYRFPDKVKENLDFMGFNYYGSEYMKAFGIEFSDLAEYNDAGRAIDPRGLYEMLKIFYDRYHLPIFITENGTADAEDFFRPSYIIEHLIAVHTAIADGVPVLGYIHWSLTDNFEWADGYCPKFGLVSVDRENDLKRSPRESFYIYSEIVKNNVITSKQRDSAWKKVKDRFNTTRLTCRSENAEDGLDSPRKETFKAIDWRFTPAPQL